jgi:hypothetical protein
MGWEETGVEDLENIPDLFPLSWKFFNAFFSAFRERAPYMTVGPRAEEFDEMMFDGPQIGYQEFIIRISWFHREVMLPQFGSFVGFGGGSFDVSNSWLTEEKWELYGSFTAGGGEDTPNGPDVAQWDEEAFRILLTEDEYESLFDEENPDLSILVRPTYWSGVYKLITNVMKYVTLPITTNLDPEPTIPHVVCNGTEEFRKTGTFSELEAITQESITNSTITPEGTTIISKGNIGATSSASLVEDVGIVNAGSSGLGYEGMSSPPFFITPTAMEIRTYLWLRRGVISQSIDTEYRAFLDKWNETLIDERSDEPSGIKISTWEDGEDKGAIYIPDAITWNTIGRFKNLNLPTTFDELTFKNTIDTSSVPDIRVSNPLLPVESTPPAVDNPDGIVFVTNDRGEQNDYRLGSVAAKLPEDIFIYTEEEEEE